MKTGLIATVVFIWVTTSIFAALLEGDMPLQAGQETTLSRMTAFTQITSEESWGVMDIIGFVPGFFGALFQVLTLQPVWHILAGGWTIVGWIVLSPLLTVIVISFILVLVAIFQKVLS